MGIRLIGLGGYAFSGKDAVADVMENAGWYRTFMSKAVLKSLIILNPHVTNTARVSDIMKLGYTEAKKYPEFRRLLQVFATEVVRNYLDPDIWIKKEFEEVKSELMIGRGVVITGIRFHNELQAIRDKGGYSFWVSRPGFEPINDHVSEHTLKRSDFDGVIDNDGTLDDLAIRAKVTMAFFDAERDHA